MVGESDLDTLISTMSPTLMQEDYVFCTVENAKYGDYSEVQPIATFQEKEGLSLVIEQCKADLNSLDYDGVFKCISLTVHSSLNAVGLTAAISNTLAKHNISANIIAGYYHDHVFVPKDLSDKAMSLLVNKLVKAQKYENSVELNVP